MTRYPYLLFDADNTLFDFDEANVSSFRAVCAYAGLAFTPELFACFDRHNNAAWARFDRGELTKDETLRIQFREMSALVPHALEVVRELKKTHRVYLITNAVESVQRGRLGRSALAPLIEEAFISEAAGAAKPSVEYFDYVFAHIDGITRENCLVIGDSLTSDIQGANNYGLACCWFNPKKAPKPESLRVDYEIRDLRELYDIVK